MAKKDGCSTLQLNYTARRDIISIVFPSGAALSFRIAKEGAVKQLCLYPWLRVINRSLVREVNLLRGFKYKKDPDNKKVESDG